MFMHKSKKGFTVVELVIVIAVIAILAAVLIPTFSNLVKKANESADVQLTRNIDGKLAYSTVTGYPATFQDVCDIMKGEGYDFSLVVTGSGATIAWDKKSNSMVLIGSDGKLLYNESKAPYADLYVPVYNDEKIPTVEAGKADKLTYVAMCTIDNASANFGGKDLDLNNNYLAVAPTSVGTVSNGFVKSGISVTVDAESATQIQTEQTIINDFDETDFVNNATKKIEIKGQVFTP